MRCLLFAGGITAEAERASCGIEPRLALTTNEVALSDRQQEEDRMAMFFKPKDGQAPVPKLCQRCGERLGTTPLIFVASGAATLRASDREAWLCDECKADLRRGAATN